MIDNILRIEDCDVLIGIFWKRFGTPVNDAKSGTEHEFLLAYNAWSSNRRPQLMIYFNQKSYMPKTKDELEQLQQVINFRENLSSEGLWWTYKSTSEFEKLIRNHLTQFILKEFSPKIENNKTNIDIKEYKFLELANSLDAIQSYKDRRFMEPWKDYDQLVKTLNSFAASFHEVDMHLTRFLSLSLTSYDEQRHHSTKEFLIKAEGGTLMIEAHEVRSYCNELRMIYENLNQIWENALSYSQYLDIKEAFRSLETFHEVNLRQLHEIMVWLSQTASKVLHKLELGDFAGANQILKQARVDILPQRQEMSNAVNALLSLESSYLEATRRAKKS
jgi:hypothetical protein